LVYVELMYRLKNTKTRLCEDCALIAVYVRCTQYAGDHFFCTAHAREQEDFGKEDPDHYFWFMTKDAP
jgi:hypothetical protein